MGKEKQTNAVVNETDEEVLVTVREHVFAASSLLKSLGEQYVRASWLLEDVLTYIEEESDRAVAHPDADAAVARYEEANAAVKETAN